MFEVLDGSWGNVKHEAMVRASHEVLYPGSKGGRTQKQSQEKTCFFYDNEFFSRSKGQNLHRFFPVIGHCQGKNLFVRLRESKELKLNFLSSQKMTAGICSKENKAETC